MTYTLKCICHHPESSHGEHGCKERGCICQHNVPYSEQEKKQLLVVGFNDDEIEEKREVA